MATIFKKKGKWYVQIRRSFHKPIYKSFIAKPEKVWTIYHFFILKFIVKITLNKNNPHFLHL